jgi:hypothetical protein
VHCGHRVALIAIVETQYGHSFVTGAAGASGASPLLSRLTYFTSTKTVNATIRKPMMSLMN